MQERFKKLFLPYLLSAVGLLAGFAVLKWVIIFKLQGFAPREELTDIFLPLIVAGIVAYFVMAKRLKALTLKENARGFLELVVWLFLSVPLIIGQIYMSDYFGQLTSIEQPSEIQQVPLSKFYSINEAEIVKEDYGFRLDRHSSNKYGTKTKVTCYYVCPIVDKVDTLDEQNVWISFSYSKEFRTKDTQKKEIINPFIYESLEQFKAHSFQLNFVSVLANSDFGQPFKDAISQSRRPFDAQKLIILEEEKGTYENRCGTELPWLIGFFVSGIVFWFLLVVLVKPKSEDLNRLDSIADKEEDRRKYKEIIGIFTPSERLWMTPILVDLNLIIYIMMVAAGAGYMYPSGKDVIAWGGTFGPLIEEGEWWRLLTSTFVHFGMAHLLKNMIVLYLLGYSFERNLGKWRFLFFYLASGLVGGFASVYWHPDSVGAGASGAIFGLVGYALVFFVVNKIPVLAAAVLAYVVFGLLLGVFNASDSTAHLGGLVCGLILGIHFVISEKIKKSKEWWI